MPGYWWRRHHFAILTGGSIILAWQPAEGAETEGHPAAASGACGRFGRADLAWVAS
jgi:hypothetical protein